MISLVFLPVKKFLFSVLLMVEPTAVIVLATLLNDNKDSATTTIKEQIVFTLISLTIERMSLYIKTLNMSHVYFL